MKPLASRSNSTHFVNYLSPIQPSVHEGSHLSAREDTMLNLILNPIQIEVQRNQSAPTVEFDPQEPLLGQNS